MCSLDELKAIIKNTNVSIELLGRSWVVPRYYSMSATFPMSSLKIWNYSEQSVINCGKGINKHLQLGYRIFITW